MNPRDIFDSHHFDTIDSFYSASEFLDSTMDYNLFVIDLILPDSSGSVTTYSDANHLTMIKDADENMYKAKDNGRNQIV